MVHDAEPQLGDVPLPVFKPEVARKRLRDPEPQRFVKWRWVQHLVSLKLHAVRVGADQTACLWWTCGNPEAPTLNADFSVVPSLDLDWCSLRLKCGTALAPSRPMLSLPLSRHSTTLPSVGCVASGLKLVQPLLVGKSRLMYSMK